MAIKATKKLRLLKYTFTNLRLNNMVLVRYTPWQKMTNLETQINRMFDDLAMNNCRHFADTPKVPAAEIYETDDALHLKLEIPGMEAKDLDIQVSKEAVFVTGERKSEIETEDKGNTRSEFYYGKFQRVIPLNVRIQNTDVTAEYKNGILNLTLPKSESEKNKVVKVSLDRATA